MATAGQFGVIITAVDETWSLSETIQRLLADNASDIVDIVVATAPQATPECLAVVAELVAQHPACVRWHEQARLPGVGGAIQECVGLVRGDWVVLMSSDLETPPAVVREMIARARRGDVDIVATSRWMDGGGFGDYSRVKLLCNWLFQKFFSLLYRTQLTDMTYGFRAYRTQLLRDYRWRETGHAYFLEALVVPLRDEQRVVEIPAEWQRRREGTSHIRLRDFLRYFYIGLCVWFRPRKKH